MGCFTFTWQIENFGIIMNYPKEKYLKSPMWKTGDNVFWNLHAYNLDLDIKFELVYLQECRNIQPCEMFLVTPWGEVPMKSGLGQEFSIEKSSITDADKKTILNSQDTLTVGCRMKGETIKTGEYHIHSVLRKMRIQWIIIMLGNLVLENDIVKETDNLTFRMIIERYSETRTYTVLVTGQPSTDGWSTFFDCKLCFKENKGRVLANTLTFPIWMWSVEISPFDITEDLQIELETIVAGHRESESPLPSSLVDDLLQLYKNNTFSDATLHTEGKSFSAHKSILAARSSSFKAIFEKEEITEGSSGVVDIKDVDNETMERMLIFMYGKNLEGVQWEEASKLYCAAKKYDVLSLKHGCSDILKAGMTVDNACDALVLADRHSDDELMKSAVDFIGKHDEVISSKTWGEMQDDNPQIAAKVMRELYLLKLKK